MPWTTQLIAGALKDVSAGENDTVWGVNAADDIYRRNGNAWTHIPGKLMQVSAGDATHVWGVNASHGIYRRNGNAWTHIPGPALKYVTVASDGTVWGVDTADDIYRRDGNAWTHIPGKLMQVSAGDATHVWGVNASHGIYRRNGNAWTHIPGPALKYVTVAGDGTVWGLDTAENIQIWSTTLNAWAPFGITAFGHFSDLSVVDSRTAWGVDAEDHIHLLADIPF
jgi:hypothetical protein